MAAKTPTFQKWLPGGPMHALYSVDNLSGSGTTDTIKFSHFAYVEHITMTDKSGDEETCKMLSIDGNVASVRAGIAGATQDIWIEVWGK